MTIDKAVERGDTGGRTRRRASRPAGPSGAEPTDSQVTMPGTASGRSPQSEAARATPEPNVAQQVRPEAPPPPSRPSRPAALPIVAGVVIVVLLAALVFLVFDRRQADALAAERGEYLSVARQTAINISTLRSESAKDDLDKLFAGTTGPLRADLEARLEDFANVVSQLDVSTTGEVVEAGLESETDNCKTSLVAVSASQQNADEEPAAKSFRLRVVICEEGGELLASNVEFVP